MKMTPRDAQPVTELKGPARTSHVLANSGNRAVLPVLLAGIKSSRQEVRAATIRAAIRRHDNPTHAQLIRHFGSLGEADQTLLCEAHTAMPHHASPALRAAVLKGDATMCKNACRIIARAGDADLFPILVKAIEDKTHRQRDDVASAIHDLTARIQHDLSQWAAGDRSAHHDPSFKRHHVLLSLEQSLSRFGRHRRQEILDAFLVLAPVDNRTFNRILHDVNHPCHAPVVKELTLSNDSGVIERLVEMLRDTELPAAALDVIAQRTDHRFVDILLSTVKRPLPLRVLHNVKRLSRIAWLEDHSEILLELDGRAQAVAVDLAAASDMTADRVVGLLAFLLQKGLAEARRASCQALARFDSANADELVLAALDDPDAGVQAAAVRQLRPRGQPDALPRLVALLDSRVPEVRDAARSSLAEFNFTRYRTMFDLLDDQSARTTGVLVHKIDHTAPQKLMEELSSPSITTILRAIDMTLAMEAANDVQQQLIELAAHENASVRREAVAALAYCRYDSVVGVLITATSDPNPMVAQAARSSLERLGHATPSPGNALLTGERA
ncbi:MAG TPA: HEAT repeat domain-containing protein [Lacipirellulaceae bacterium]|nr:HEAT repeat domain-containing protein [Lacipirellulaceae bacterium]